MYKFDGSYIRDSPSQTSKCKIKIQLHLHYQVQCLHLCTPLTYHTIQTLCQHLFFDMCRFTMYTSTLPTQSFKCYRPFRTRLAPQYD